MIDRARWQAWIDDLKAERADLNMLIEACERRLNPQQSVLIVRESTYGTKPKGKLLTATTPKRTWKWSPEARTRMERRKKERTKAKAADERERVRRVLPVVSGTDEA